MDCARAFQGLRARARMVIGLGLPLAIGGAGLALITAMTFGGARAAQPPGGASSTSSPTVHALARLEPETGLVVIGARPGARIERIAVGVHDKVPAGGLLAITEGHAQAEAQLALAEAQKARAEHLRDVKKRQLALERELFDKQQEARLEAAPRVFGSRQRWNEIAAIYKQLMDDKTLPPLDKFNLMTRYLDADGQYLRGELEVKSFQAAQKVTPRQREIEDQELGDKWPESELLDRQIALARAGVDAAEVKAPFAGEVQDIMAHAGEVSSGPLLLLADTSAMVATAEVDQSDVTRLKLGDTATVRVIDQSVTGKVTVIGTIVGKNLLANLDPRALQDRRVAKVKIRLDDPALARRLINMEVDVAIRVGAASPAGASSHSAP